MKTSIDDLTLSELSSLLAAAQRRRELISARRPPAVVRRELIEVALSYGYAIDEVIDVSPADGSAVKPAKRQKRARAAVKYRDPENKRNTWSGRGRQPRWLAEKTKRGQSITDFLIPGLGRPTPANTRLIGNRSVYKPVAEETKR